MARSFYRVAVGRKFTKFYDKAEAHAFAQSEANRTQRYAAVDPHPNGKWTGTSQWISPDYNATTADTFDPGELAADRWNEAVR